MYTNGYIDLRYLSDYGRYFICFHGDKKSIGELSFRYLLFADNISYFIEEEYRNKGLGFQSVCLFLKYLNSKGINSVTIHVEKTNLPSLRIAEKLKNIYHFNSITETEWSVMFHVSIDKLKQESNSILK